MKKLEKILILNAVFALAFFAFKISLANILLIISISTLAMLYMYFSFALLNDVRFREIFKKGRFKGISDIRIIGTILVGLTSSLTLIGIIFKLMHWPSAVLNLAVGLLGLLIALGVSIFKFTKTKDSFYKNISIRLGILSLFAIIFLLIPRYTFIEWHYQDNPEFIEALKEYDKDPSNPEAIERYEEEQEKLMETIIEETD